MDIGSALRTRETTLKKFLSANGPDAPWAPARPRPGTRRLRAQVNLHALLCEGLFLEKLASLTCLIVKGGRN